MFLLCMDLERFSSLDLALELSNFAIDVDNYILGRNSNLDGAKFISELLKKYQLDDTKRVPMGHFADLYVPLWNAARKNSGKEINTSSELALEMRLLRSELDNIYSSKRLEELRDFLVYFSSECLNASHNYRTQFKRLAA